MNIEEIEFKGEKKDDSYIPYVPYTPDTVKMITQGHTKPSLCSVGNGMGEPHVYEIEKMRMTVFLNIVEEHEEWSVTTPLGMCRYVKPEGDLLFNNQACEDATRENARRQQHNKFVVDIFREFMATYDCGASANRMTLPQAPDDFVQVRLDKIKEIKNDKLGCAQKAIEYLALYEVYCGRDYKFEDAFEKANDVCYEKTVEAKGSSGSRIRVRLEGRLPCWWDGKSSTDESGCRVKWARGPCHTFLTPDVHIAKDDTPDQIIALQAACPTEEPSATSDNPFATLFQASQQLAIEESAAAVHEDSVVVEEVTTQD